jgi:hypothetical protein
MLVEQLDQLGEIRQRLGQPVDLVHHYNVYLAGPDLGEKLLEGRAVERSPRKRPIIVMVGDQSPALVTRAEPIRPPIAATSAVRHRGR